MAFTSPAVTVSAAILTDHTLTLTLRFQFATITFMTLKFLLSELTACVFPAATKFPMDSSATRLCEHCHEYYPRDTLTVTGDGSHVCSQCIDEDYAVCDECDEYFRRNELSNFVNADGDTEDFLRLTQKKLFKKLCKKFKGKTLISKGNFILVRSVAPVMLVAHLGTVHEKPVHDICKSDDSNILMTPQGIGGDDRCGCYSLVKIYKSAQIKL